MNNIFQKEIAEGWVVIYMDNIVVHSKNVHKHWKYVAHILHILWENKLSLKPEKCWFDKEEIGFLGIIVSKDSVKMDPAKVWAIIDWPAPKCKQDVQQFLGFINFYWQFCKGHTKIAKSLSKLTSNLEWQWGPEQWKAFEQLKRKIAYELALAILDPNRQFRMETDTSDFAVAAILSQLQDDKTWRPVAFFLKAMNPADRNYEIYDKEMLAIMKAFEEWLHYIKGAQEMIEVLTDHQNLTYLHKPQNLNWQQAWWILDLQEYHFVIKHWPGRTNTKADILSQGANYIQGKNNNKGITMLKEEWFVCLWDNNSAIFDMMMKVQWAPKNLWDPEVTKELQNPEGIWEEWQGSLFRKEVMTIQERNTDMSHKWKKNTSW